MTHLTSEMTTIQKQIGEWHRATFSGRRPLATAKKALEEASELHVAAKHGSTVTISEECADVAIVLFALAEMCDFDLGEVVLEKLEILKLRPDQKERDRERGID